MSAVPPERTFATHRDLLTADPALLFDLLGERVSVEGRECLVERVNLSTNLGRRPEVVVDVRILDEPP